MEARRSAISIELALAYSKISILPPTAAQIDYDKQEKASLDVKLQGDQD